MTARAFYSVSQFAEVLAFTDPQVGGAGYQRVLGAIARKEIRATKFGREYRIPITEVQRLGELFGASA